MVVADYWWWLSAAMILMVLEILTPGVFFLWIGFGALVTGLIVAACPTLSFAVSGGVFAVLSVISVFVGRKVMKRMQTTTDTGLNNRAAQYIGQVYQVYEPIADGRGKISVGDTLWLAFADTNIPAGASVKVVGFRGTMLEVEPINGN